MYDPELCWTCKGTGVKEEERVCPECLGATRIGTGKDDRLITCPKCDGVGTVMVEERCPTCGGTGQA
ncbi:MAG: hypothetical protein IT324_33375 [Anaerolineae bacterium]|nr:hypothetical protein [Anaerolineae bacterium]